MCSYKVRLAKIRISTKSSYHMLLRMQFVDINIHTNIAHLGADNDSSEKHFPS